MHPPVFAGWGATTAAKLAKHTPLRHSDIMLTDQREKNYYLSPERLELCLCKCVNHV